MCVCVCVCFPILIFCSHLAQCQIRNFNETGNVMVSEFGLFLWGRARRRRVSVSCVSACVSSLPIYVRMHIAMFWLLYSLVDFFLNWLFFIADVSHCYCLAQRDSAFYLIKNSLRDSWKRESFHWPNNLCGIPRSRVAMDLSLEKSLQGAGLGKGDMEDKLLPMQQVPPLHVPGVWARVVWKTGWCPCCRSPLSMSLV